MYHFFLVPYATPTRSYYQMYCIAVAQGMRALGIPYTANITYWHEPEHGASLFEASPQAAADAKVWIYESVFFEDKTDEETDRILAEIPRHVTAVLLDLQDGYTGHAANPRFARFDLIFRAHWSDDMRYLPATRPAAFPLIDQVANRLTTQPPLPKEPVVWVNYRLAHSLRKLVNTELLDKLNSKEIQPLYYQTESLDVQEKDTEANPQNHYWAHTGRRFNPPYLDKLNEVAAVSCAGGFFMPRPGTGLAARLQTAVRNRIGVDYSQYITCIQWDSYRFMETFFSQACPLHLHLDTFRLRWQHQPVAGKHYAAIPGTGMAAFAKKWPYSAAQLQDIGMAGQEWAMQYYSSAAIAQYLLAELDKLARAN